MLYTSEGSIMAETLGGHWKMKRLLCASQEAMAYHQGPESCCPSKETAQVSGGHNYGSFSLAVTTERTSVTSRCGGDLVPSLLVVS